jgi:hypothetical protein
MCELDIEHKYEEDEPVFQLNHPWKIYWKEPLSSYTRYFIYHNELLRLLKFVNGLNTNIHNLNRTQVQLTNFIIGTPMEDIFNREKEIALQMNKNFSFEFLFQWQQLFPVHIKKFINYYSKFDNDINVNIIIISPDEVFMDTNYKEPLFTTCCKDFKFLKIANREYLYSQGRVTIKVDIFTCPFPQLETNMDIIRRYNTFIKKISDFELTGLGPSENDVKFINTFYETLSSIAENPASNMIINSYATFKNVTGYENYGLFPSLLELANKYKIIATEWNFTENNFLTRIVSKINFTVNYLKYSLSYLDPDESISMYMLSEYKKLSLLELKKLNNELYCSRKPMLCIIMKFPYNKLVMRGINYE